MKIRDKLIVVIFGLTAAPVLCVSLLTYMYTKTTIQEMIIEKQELAINEVAAAKAEFGPSRDAIIFINGVALAIAIPTIFLSARSFSKPIVRLQKMIDEASGTIPQEQLSMEGALTLNIFPWLKGKRGSSRSNV